MSLLVVGKSANERKRVVVEKVSSSEESSAEEGCGEERSRRTLQDATDGAWMLKLNISVPSQTQFHCEVCTLNYTTLASLRRHLKTSHSRYTVEESFSCDVCGKLASTLKAIKAHQKSTHIGTAPQTATFDDDANSVSPCPYCPLRFPSKKSLGQHVRGKHMDEASSERAAASRDNDGKRKLWDPVEVDKFKEALRRLGPSSNVDIANEIGTRTCKQVGVFKRAFLLKNPTWLTDNRPSDTVPAPPLQQIPLGHVSSNLDLNLNLNTASSPCHPAPPHATCTLSPPLSQSTTVCTDTPRADNAHTSRLSPPFVLCTPPSSPLHVPALSLSHAACTSSPPLSSQSAATCASLTPSSQLAATCASLIPSSQPVSISPSSHAMCIPIPHIPHIPASTPPPPVLPLPSLPLAAYSPSTAPSADPTNEDINASLRAPFYSDVRAFYGRVLQGAEWEAFCKTLLSWAHKIRLSLPTSQTSHPTTGWARRRHQGRRPPPLQSGYPDIPPSEDAAPRHPGERGHHRRASGRQREAAKASQLQRSYRFNPGACIRKILDDTPPTYCTIPEPELIAHFSATYAPPQPISEPPPWLVALDSQEDVLATPFTPSEVLHQMQRAKKSAPGSDKLTYANWKWADPEGVTLAAVFNICREAGHPLRVRRQRAESPSENTRQRSPTDVVTISDDENMDDPPTPFITPPSSPCHSIIPSSIHTPPSTSALPSPLVPDAHLSPTPSIFHNLLHAAPFVPASLPPPLLTSPSPITPPPQSPSSLLLNSLPEVAQGETVPRLSSQHASHQDPTPAPAVDLDDLDATLRLPFYEDLVPFKDRVMGEPEWITFQKVISRWSTVIQGLTATQQHRPSNPSAEWGKRRRRNKNGAQEPRDLEQPQNTTAEPPAVDDESGTRASGRARHAAKARFFQGLYKRNPAECVRRLLNDTPPVYCSIPEAELVTHFTAAYAPAPSLAPPPSWLYRHDTQGVSGDVLAEPFTPQETIIQLKRAKKSAPGVDRITYGTWRWVDPLGLILSTIFNICRVNSRVPSDWKHATVTLIHKGGDTASVRNWRPICLQLTIYKLYTAILARRIADWALLTSAFSAAQKGFLAFDGCVEHNFLLQALLTDSRRSKRDLMLAWLDLRDAFGSVPHELLMLMMRRLGLSGGIIETVRDIYDHSSVAINRSILLHVTYTPRPRCPLSPILFNIALEGLLRHLTSSKMGWLQRKELGWQKRHLVPQLLKEGIAVRRLSAMTGHPDQGAFLTFPQYRFVHKARLDLLPVRTVQARCRKAIPSTLCRVCGRFQETLAHVLNHCHPSMGLIRDRHNAILDRIIRAVPDSLGAKYKEQPLPGTSGNNRPDLTVIAPDDSYAIIVDVSCPFEGSPTALEEAAQAKLLKYEPLRQSLLQRFPQVTILPFIVGSLGSWYPPNDKVLSSLHIGSQYASLMRKLCVVSAIAGSQTVWYQTMCSPHRGARVSQPPDPLASNAPVS
eukprot:Em0054g35a